MKEWYFLDEAERIVNLLNEDPFRKIPTELGCKKDKKELTIRDEVIKEKIKIPGPGDFHPRLGILFDGVLKGLINLALLRTLLAEYEANGWKRVLLIPETLEPPPPQSLQDLSPYGVYAFVNRDNAMAIQLEVLDHEGGSMFLREGKLDKEAAMRFIQLVTTLDTIKVLWKKGIECIALSNVTEESSFRRWRGETILFLSYASIVSAKTHQELASRIIENYDEWEGARTPKKT